MLPPLPRGQRSCAGSGPELAVLRRESGPKRGVTKRSNIKQHTDVVCTGHRYLVRYSRCIVVGVVLLDNRSGVGLFAAKSAQDVLFVT